MGRLRTAPAADPSTGKPLPDGVRYRGFRQYRARKLVNGKRVAKTFDTAKKAGDWLKAVEVDTSRGVFVDTTTADKHKLGNLLCSYQFEVLEDDPDRVLTDREGKACPYGPIREVLQAMPTELLGAEREIGFIDVILRDEVCAIRMAALTGADVAQFRNRMKDASQRTDTHGVDLG